MPLIFFIVSGMLLLTSVTKAEDNLKDIKLLCRYELYTRAVEPGRSAWTIYTPQGLEFIDNKNMIIYTIASGIDNFNLMSEKREYVTFTNSIEIKKKNSKDKDFYIDRTTLEMFYVYGGIKSPCLEAGQTDSLPKILEGMWKNVSTSIKSKRKI